MRLQLRYFNSIKVRLILVRISTHTIKEKFQFHKGSINTIEIIFIFRVLIDFNSIKVRLIPEGNEHFEASEQFQFHKGSINTAQEFENQHQNETISIP